jgi:hypothetical protein
MYIFIYIYAYIGTYPEILQDVWDDKMKNLKRKFDDDMRNLRKELEEVNLNFNAYKSRAQTALKRLGVDDRNERQKVCIYVHICQLYIYIHVYTFM